MIRAWIAMALAVMSASPVHAATLQVFAAASLREAFVEIGKRFEKDHPGERVAFNFAGSNVLRTQIEHGAAADVFASADELTMKRLRQDRAVEKPVTFAHNRLVLVAPPDSPVRDIPDLARRGVRLVLAGTEVPAGRYAEQALRLMDKSGAYGTDFRARVMANVVSRDTNVRAVLAKVTLAEADAGFVYATDAAAARGKIRRVPLPERFSPTGTYPVAVVSRSRQKPLAEAFIRMLQGAEGRAILAAHGFRP